jgi:hypothetical protein
MTAGNLVRGIAMISAFGGMAAAQPPSGPVLNANTVIVLSPDEVGPVKKAANDLAGDFEKVFGKRPRIVATQPAGGTALVVGREKGAAESFSIHADGRVVHLDGADMRGTIYAIYELSQDYLGVDPLYYWTDRAPAKKAQVSLPAGLNRDFPAPLFKYRGFFINDEDMLTGWAPGDRLPEHSGIRLSVMDKIYETVLRLKGNMIVPGTWTFPTDPQMKPVGERGLILTQHHAIPVGMNVARWPQNVPYSMSAHPEILERAWTNAVNSYDPKQEILWSVGLRGLSDTSYASMDPSVVGNDKLQGELISKAIQDQMRIVRARFPNAQFDTDLWQEGARLAKEGYLKIPPEVMTVWADTGYGLVKDGGAVAKGQGMYYHVAMLNGRANQLGEMVPADRIYSEFGRYIKAGATSYMLVNTSDVRAVTLGARTVMDTAWGGVPEGGADATYRKWSSYEFGDKAADAVAGVYRDYFAAIPKLPNGDDYGDQLYHSEARQLMMSAMIDLPHYTIPGQSPKWTEPRIIGLNPENSRGVGPDYIQKTTDRELKVCAEARPKWDAVWRDAVKAEALVDPARKPFYDYAVLTMIAINRDSNHILLQVSKAVRDAQGGDKAKAKKEVLATMADFDEIKRLQKQAEYGKWKHWWRGEWLVGIDGTRDLVNAYLRFLDDPQTTLPSPAQAYSWQGYYHIMRYEGDQTANVK